MHNGTQCYTMIHNGTQSLWRREGWHAPQLHFNVLGWEPALEPPTQPSPILRKINFLIWDRIWPALGYVQAIGVLGTRFWALFDVSYFYLFRQVWSLTNLWPCSNLGFPRSIFFFFAPKYPSWLIEHGCAKWWGWFPRRVLIAERWHPLSLDCRHSPFWNNIAEKLSTWIHKGHCTPIFISSHLQANNIPALTVSESA